MRRLLERAKWALWPALMIVLVPLSWTSILAAIALFLLAATVVAAMLVLAFPVAVLLLAALSLERLYCYLYERETGHAKDSPPAGRE